MLTIIMRKITFEKIGGYWRGQEGFYRIIYPAFSNIFLFFIIGYFTRFKYLTLILVFIRGLYFTVYVAILFELVTFGGITVAILVFIPTYIISFAFCWFIAEYCKLINKKYIFFVPAILALTNTVVLTILVNVVFRVVIEIGRAHV